MHYNLHRVYCIYPSYFCSKLRCVQNQPILMYCTVGSVDFLLFYIFNKHTLEDCCIRFKRRKYEEKKFFWTQWLLHRRYRHSFTIQYKGLKFFFHNMDFMGIKRRRMLRRFLKYKLTLVTQCT
jgi:hypothetical protein